MLCKWLKIKACRLVETCAPASQPIKHHTCTMTIRCKIAVSKRLFEMKYSCHAIFAQIKSKAEEMFFSFVI
jgi:hypothetical protein